MIDWLPLVVLVATIATTYFAALAIALSSVSESALAERFDRAGGGGRWMFGRLAALSQLVGFLRTTGRVSILVALVVEFCGFGEGSRIDLRALATVGVIAIVLLWVFTSVVAASLARHAAVGLVATAAPLLRAIDAVGWPLRVVDRLVDEAVRRLAGAGTPQAQGEEDLLRSIEDTQRQGHLDESAAEILGNVIAFSETEVGSVMTPRTDVEGIEYTDDLAAIRDFFSTAGHSRIPVYEGNLDQILGILYVKDLIAFLGQDAAEFRLRPLLRQPIRVPETKPVRDLLRDFQHSEIHLAIVIDEYGGTSGLVTIEDLLEEIVGEIHDEHEPPDEELPSVEEHGGAVEADGRVPIESLAERLEIALPEDREYDTAAGFLLAHFGRVPATGEVASIDGWRFIVLDAVPTHIRRIRVERAAEASTAGRATSAPAGE